MVKKEKADKVAQKRARAAQKAKKKAKQNEAKQNRRHKELWGEDQDIGEILEQFKKDQEKLERIEETVLDGRPSHRVNGSLFGHPNKPELFLFGGEYYNGSTITFYNDLFSYSVPKKQWKKIASLNSPLPRSSHQIVMHSSGLYYLFGGEFASPRQTTFYHYNDFWSFNPNDHVWSKLENNGDVPCARSGHRMISWKRWIILFGGFVDTSSQTKYLNDLWAFDLDSYTWTQVKFSAISMQPDPRSGPIFQPAKEDYAILMGGYSKLKTGKNSTRGVCHTDCWTLKLDGEPANWKWERRKKPANAPSTRVGASSALHKGRVIIFGGVYDYVDTEETLDSVFYKELWALNIDANKWYNLRLKATGNRKGGKNGPVDVINKKSSIADDLIENERAVMRLENLDQSGSDQTQHALQEEDDTQLDEVLMNKDSNKEILVSTSYPHERFNASVAVMQDRIWIYSGLYEANDREYTLDSLHCVDLNKLDGCVTLWETRLETDGEWLESADDDSGSDSEDEEDLSPPVQEDGAAQIPEPEEARLEGIVPQEAANDEAGPESSTINVASLLSDPNNPRPFESLRDFFSRTANDWVARIFERPNYSNGPRLNAKEARTAAFGEAEQHYWAMREDIRMIEQQRESSGIGTMVERQEGTIPETRSMKRR